MMSDHDVHAVDRRQVVMADGLGRRGGGRCCSYTYLNLPSPVREAALSETFHVRRNAR